MGFGRSAGEILGLCVELATVLHAAAHVAASISYSEMSTLYADFYDDFESYVNGRTIELAVNLRAFLDKCSAYAEGGKIELPTEAIWFIEGSGRSTLRECANKIIHASYFRFDTHFEQIDSKGVRLPYCIALGSIVEVAGSHRGVPWKCKIDLLRFTNESHLAVCNLREEYIGLVDR
jgi:hypothetical protein